MEYRVETQVDCANLRFLFNFSKIDVMRLIKQEDRKIGVLTHLLILSGCILPFGNIIGPLTLWQLKRKESNFVDRSGKAILNFQLSFSIYLWISAVATYFFSTIFMSLNSAIELPSLLKIGMHIVVSLAILIFVFSLVLIISCTLIGLVRASRGKVFDYPFVIRFLK